MTSVPGKGKRWIGNIEDLQGAETDSGNHGVNKGFTSQESDIVHILNLLDPRDIWSEYAGIFEFGEKITHNRCKERQLRLIEQLVGQPQHRVGRRAADKSSNGIPITLDIIRVQDY